MTFYDVKDVRQEQLNARRAAAVTQAIVDTVRDPLIILDADLRITTASRNFVALFGNTEADLVGRRIEDLKQGQWDIASLKHLLEKVVPNEAPFEDFLVEDNFPGLGPRVFKLNARKIFVLGNHVTQLLLAFEDVTDAVAADRYKELMTAELAHRIKNSLSVKVDAEPLAINADQAVPVGLLVNELATNGVKYAFPAGRGQITFAFRRRDGEVALSVEDDGVGLDNATTREGSTGMGTRFVDAFVRQIGGTLARATGSHGTTITVRLPASILQ